MASSLRKAPPANDKDCAKFLYVILKQMELKNVNWQKVADDMGIGKGHAARMRYHRFKQNMEGEKPSRRTRATDPEERKQRKRRVRAARKKSEGGEDTQEEEEEETDTGGAACSSDTAFATNVDPALVSANTFSTEVWTAVKTENDAEENVGKIVKKERDSDEVVSGDTDTAIKMEEH
ncbi:MAG: hypothetical protein LQ340_002173 [Diploschistes diacapsis]|nr:MAG: hypothetical protein LQ340_002173 [Diploschistes diacapsis]